MSAGNQGPTYVARHFVVSGEEFRRASGNGCCSWACF